MASDGVRRMAAIHRLARNCQIRERLWLTSFSALRDADIGQHSQGGLKWLRASEMSTSANLNELVQF